MIITLFENDNFIEWCKSSLKENQNSILKLSYDVLTCFVESDDVFEEYEEMLSICLDNPNLLGLRYKDNFNGKILFDSCLIDRKISLSVEKSILNFCSDRSEFNRFIEKLAFFITDATIVLWKKSKQISFNSISFYNKYSTCYVEFPISYKLNSFIKYIEKTLNKNVVFYLNHNKDLYKEDSNVILCEFIPIRYKSEFCIQKNLFRYYLDHNNFPNISSNLNLELEASTSNNIYNWENVKSVLYILFQDTFFNLFIKSKYSVYSNVYTYDLINVTEDENNIPLLLEYLCKAFVKHKVCLCEDSLTCFADKDCVLYGTKGLLSKKYNLEDIDTIEKQEVIICEFKKYFEH